ncbi:tRNA threonylcarbamoyladenosine biosynthesis protein TsaE [Deinobacterium chartae]|uniref:tRNA threonylcarbamoyladenosine biosynthesis protein TsaE n=1 Tax=Deinobacterium chartae TaxID=521158 RepID=A0A841I059_9DEIO|nr:tRNA (adenosine(37)-N6)-threonylcarbamoyltransferase complex ATPase subunit type 1 TsaE [Deinobacterium chartae]MBB6098344.1 tRNA threonylcarbamoyladenosine biosynthesis protein TsaE [Deinobacterium chartae]
MQPLEVGAARLLRSPEEQTRLGRVLGEHFASGRGQVLFLEGELGAGKTTLTQGIVAGLDFTGEVTSPTYALMHLYPSPHGTVVHVDAYRVRHVAELYEMGLEDEAERAVLTIIEWGESLYEDFPHAWILRLTYAPEGRRIERLR